jgi:hypothetical protein
VKTKLKLHLLFLALAAAGLLPAFAADLPPSGTNTIQGLVQFANADPDILARLGPPGNEGMTDYALYAYSDSPDSLSAIKGVSGADKLSNPYTLTVTANNVPRFYDVFSVLSLDGQVEEYWTPTYSSALLTSNSPPATVDFNECVALLEIRYQRPDGTPVAALGGRAVVNETATPNYYRGGYSSQPAGRMTNFLVVPSGVEFALSIEADTGTDIYADRITHIEQHTLTFACDEKPVLTLTIPDAGTLGRIVGNINMEGKIELPTDGYQELLGRPVIKALGSSGNRRYGALDPEWPGPDLLRAFALENLVPSIPAQLWRLQAEMQFNEDYRFEYFVTPALGEGLNPGVAVTAGATTDLGDQFVMNPATLGGKVTLTGPPEFGGILSALRGVFRSADNDPDMDGIPNDIGATAINGSYVGITGVDELAPGATLATVGGSAAVSFAGAFNPATGAFEGDYEAKLGMLDDQPGVWQRDGLNLQIYNLGTNGGPHVNEVISIAEQQAEHVLLAPGEQGTRDVSYGFAEVCYRIKSPAPFFNPRVTSSIGYHTNYDGAGDVLNSYRTTISSAYGLPNTAAQATNEALLTIYVPAGSYTLSPAISIVDSDGGVSDTQLPSIEISVAAHERYCLEECVRVFVEPPICTTNFGFLGWGSAVSLCGETLTNLSVSIRPLSDPSILLGSWEICTISASNTLRMPGQVFFLEVGDDLSLYNDMVWTVVAKDNQGHVATRSIIAHYDFTAPELQCPGDLTTTSPDGAGVPVDFTVTATDNRPEPLRGPICLPPSGSVFSVGTTTVICTASDLCRNTNTCTFQVIVRSPATPLLAVDGATAIPGGTGNFTSLPRGPSLSGSSIAFYGAGSGGQQGIYVQNRLIPSDPIRIADLNTPIPNGSGNFLSFAGEPAIPTDPIIPSDPLISGDNVVFYGAGSDGQRGIYGLINSSRLRVADTSTAIPGGSGNFTGFTRPGIPPNPIISGENAVFYAEGSGGQQGVYARINGSLTKIADTTTAIPGGTGSFTAIPVDPIISGDDVVFVGNGSGGQQGVYLSKAGSLSVIADTQTAIPNGVGKFVAIPQEPTIGGDRVAFVGFGSGGQQGVYAIPVDPVIPSDPVKVADLNTAIPRGSGSFTGFGAVSVSATDVAFLGTGTGGQSGIYDLTGGQLVKAIAVGDTISGKTVTGLNFTRSGLFGDPIAFQATFDDGSQDLYTSAVVAPPFALRISAVARLGNDLRLSFNSLAGTNYVIQSRADLASGSWATLPGTTNSGTGSTVEQTLINAVNTPQQFYRVKQLP